MLTGKLPPALLARLIAGFPPSDPRVVVGPDIGVDAAVLDFDDRYLVVKSDPITFATDRIGWYAVHVNANDVATMGARPRWFLATILLPPGATEADAEATFDQIGAACAELGVDLVGGHTEVTHDLDRTIVVGCMLGEVARDRLITPRGARPGDELVLTKGIAIEGTAVLAREKPDLLVASGLSDDLIGRAGRLLVEPGIGVVPEALLAAELGAHALHDPTEGGLATAVAELATAAGVGIVVEAARIPVLAETAAVCTRLGLDPLGLLASGALLIAVPPDRTARLLAGLDGAGIPAAIVGRATEPGEGTRLVAVDGNIGELPRFARDELARLFDSR